jgi:hypothetical protein
MKLMRELSDEEIIDIWCDLDIEVPAHCSDEFIVALSRALFDAAWIKEQDETNGQP